MRLLCGSRKFAFRNRGLVDFSLAAGLRAIKEKRPVACGRLLAALGWGWGHAAFRNRGLVHFLLAATPVEKGLWLVAYTVYSHM